MTPSLPGYALYRPLLKVAEFLRRVLKLCAIRLADLLSRLDCHPADPQLLLAEVGRPWVGWGLPA